MLRVIGEVKPAWVVGENVAGLLSMDGGAVFEEICASLEAEGYAVEAFVLPAISRGAPHRRDRIWITAYSESAANRGGAFEVSSPNGRQNRNDISESGIADQVYVFTADSQCFRQSGQRSIRYALDNQENWEKTDRALCHDFQSQHWYEAATRLCTMDDGVSRGLVRSGRIKDRAKKLKAAGNAIVPQVAYEIFRAIQIAQDELSQPILSR